MGLVVLKIRDTVENSLRLPSFVQRLSNGSAKRTVLQAALFASMHGCFSTKRLAGRSKLYMSGRIGARGRTVIEIFTFKVNAWSALCQSGCQIGAVLVQDGAVSQKSCREPKINRV